MRARLRTYASWLALVLASTSTLAQQAFDVPSMVAQFYPPSLDADLAAIGAGNTDVRRQCHVVLESGADGSALTVLAGYTNSQAGVIRVLRKSAAGFDVADEAVGALLIGSSCRAGAVDIDRDGTPEAVVKFATRTGSRDWIYAWRDGALVDLSPLTSDGVAIVVSDSDFIDLDNDGLLELRSRPPRASASDPAPPAVIFRLSAGSYVLIP